MSKVNLDVMKPWITKRLQELLGVEDDVVIEYVFNQLDDKVRSRVPPTRLPCFSIDVIVSGSENDADQSDRFSRWK